MRLALLTTTAIVITAFWSPFSLADSAKVEISIAQNKQYRSDDYERINRAYQEILGRNPDTLTLRTWVREIQRGNSIKDLRRQLAYSQEAENAINQIYQEFLGRNPDAEGLRIWQRILTRGGSLEYVRRQVERSREARERRLSLPNPPTLGGI